MCRHTGIQTESDGSLCVYFVVQIPPFKKFIDWSCTVVVHARKEYVLATAEMTQSLQVDLVLSGAAATHEPQLVQ